MAYDYAYMEGYELQPTKSVALNIKAKPNKRSLNTREFKLGAQTMPTVESALHLGIIRTTSLKDNMIKNVEENIKKSYKKRLWTFWKWIPWKQWSRSRYIDTPV
jgi:hypothetical protein